MSFIVTIEPGADEELESFEQFQDMVDYITGKLAYWNNFASHKPFTIEFEKDDDKNALGVNVVDDTLVKALFGG